MSGADGAGGNTWLYVKAKEVYGDIFRYKCIISLKSSSIWVIFYCSYSKMEGDKEGKMREIAVISVGLLSEK